MNQQILNRLDKLGNEIKMKIRCSKNEFYSSLSEKLKRSPTELWKFVKQSARKKKTIPPMSTDQGFITNYVDKANRFRNTSNLFFYHRKQ